MNTAALLGALLLLAANAFFVGAEFALISARRDRLESMATRGVHRARTVIRAGEKLSLMLAAAQLGITISSLGLGALGEPVVARQLEWLAGPLGIPDAVLHTISFVIALGIVTVAHILLGEMVPKNIAIAGPERTALWMVPPLVAWMRLMRPVIAVLNRIANHVLRAFGVQPRDELDSAYSPDELANLIADSSREGLLDSEEHRRLTQMLSTMARAVADVLVPISSLTTVPAEPVLGDIERAVAQTGFSRFPLCTGADRQLVGYLHVKDVLDLLGRPPDTPVPPGSVRPLPEVQSTAKLDEALALLRRSSSHLARVVRPDGSTAGVVALEDLVEEYVGTVRDATHVPPQLG
ncbi:MAG: hemolysin family protein [Actinomycetota bacterium]|jgi:CBS domain containing-hemolysin-like protein|nr:hemolysin family protein [Actinomycetota bacterium]